MNQMRVCHIQIGDSKDNIYDIYGYLFNNELIFTCKEFITIAPKQEIIDNYFNKLEGFEQVLLNRNSVPLYKNLFILILGVFSNGASTTSILVI